MQSLTVHRTETNRFILYMLMLTIALVATAGAWYVWRLEAKWAIFGFLGILFPFIVVMASNVRRFLMWWMIFLIPLGIDYKFFYHVTHSGQPGVSLGTTEIILSILVIHWLINAAKKKMAQRVQLFPAITVPTLAFIVMNAISMIAAKDPILTLFDVIVYVKMLIFFLYLANNLKDQDDLSLVLSALFLGLVIQAIFMVLQFYKGSALGLVGTDELQNFLAFRREGYIISRPGGTVGNVNYFARYLGFVLPIASVVMITSHERKYFPLSLLATFGGMIALIIAQTRSVWGPYLVGMMIALFLILIRNLLTMRTIKRIFLGMLLFTLVLVFYRDLVYRRLTADDHGSAKARITTSKVALKIIKDHPLTGIGANNYDFHIRNYWLVEDIFTKFAVVHNYYLLHAAQLGLFGLGVFLWLLVAFFVRIWKATKSRVKYFRKIAVGIMASFICFLLAAIADGYNGIVLLYLFWALAAIIEAILYLEKQYDEQILAMMSEKEYLHEF